MFLAECGSRTLPTSELGANAVLKELRAALHGLQAALQVTGARHIAELAIDAEPNAKIMLTSYLGPDALRTATDGRLAELLARVGRVRMREEADGFAFTDWETRSTTSVQRARAKAADVSHPTSPVVAAGESTPLAAPAPWQSLGAAPPGAAASAAAPPVAAPPVAAPLVAVPVAVPKPGARRGRPKGAPRPPAPRAARRRRGGPQLAAPEAAPLAPPPPPVPTWVDLHGTHADREATLEAVQALGDEQDAILAADKAEPMIRGAPRRPPPGAAGTRSSHVLVLEDAVTHARRVWLPPKHRIEAVQALHHLHTNAADLHEYAKRCPSCQLTRIHRLRRGMGATHGASTRAGELHVVDAAEFLQTWYLVVVDAHTRYTLLAPLGGKDAASTLAALYNVWGCTRT